MTIKTIEECLSCAAYDCEIVSWNELFKTLTTAYTVNGERRDLLETAQEFWESCGGEGFAEFVEGHGYYPDIAVFETASERDEWLNRR